jgi:protein gp37
VWLGVSVEDQAAADLRIPKLLATPAVVRFLSCEPLLGPVDLAGFLPRPAAAPLYPVECRHGDDVCPICDRTMAPDEAVNWIIAGGESGPNARIMEPAWARQLRDQATATGVAFHFKQWGEWAPTGWKGIGRFDAHQRLVGPELDADGHRELMERVGKKAAGRELDGRTWDEWPT